MRLGDLRVPLIVPQHIIPTYGPEHESSAACWCQPQRVCLDCGHGDWRMALGPCIHGPDRTEIVVHREPS